jgi:hypothetical protein
MGGKKEYQKEYHKEYYNDNKEYQKEYHKEYCNDNKDIIARNKKEYRKLNLEKLTEKHECLCGGKYTCENKSQHFKSKKHIKYTEQQNKEE